MKRKHKIILISTLTLIAVLAIAWFVSFGIFLIPTSAMENTLKSKSHVIVNKLNKIPEQNDLIVFRFPEGDTVATKREQVSYYELCRQYGREKVWTNPSQFGEIKYVPLKKRDFYVKRVVGMPGDKFDIIDGEVFINDFQFPLNENLKYNYMVIADKNSFNDLSNILTDMEISLFDQNNAKAFVKEFVLFVKEAKNSDINNCYIYSLTESMAEKIRKIKGIRYVVKIIKPKDFYQSYIFPHNKNFGWNEDNFGPLFIPKSGQTIELKPVIVELYRRLIETYENNDFDIKSDGIYINGKKATHYQFKQNYYFVLGDNRHDSADSRFWGLVPEDHIYGVVFGYK